MKNICLLFIISIISISAFAQDLSYSPTPVTMPLPDAPNFVEQNIPSSNTTTAPDVMRLAGNPEWAWKAPMNGAELLNDIHYASASVGYAVGNLGTVLKSTDAGTTWQRLPTPFNNSLLSVSALTANTLTVCGENGLLATSTNGGTSWTVASAGTAATFRSVRYINSTSLVASGDSMRVVRSTDSGGTWQALSVPATAVLNPNNRTLWSYSSLNVSGSDTLYLGVQGAGMPLQVIRSINGGGAWAAVSVTGAPSPPTTTTFGVTGIEFSGSTGFASYFTALAGGVLRTTDGGTTWAIILGNSIGSFAPLPNPDVPFVSTTVQFRQSLAMSSNAQTIVTGGLFGQILASTDGGSTWAEIYGGVRQGFRDFFTFGFPGAAINPDGTAWLICGTNGTLAGATGFQPNTATVRSGQPLPVTLRDIAFVNSTLGFAVGFQQAQQFTNAGGTVVDLAISVVLRTTDGGNSWSRIDGPQRLDSRWNAIECIGSNIWVGGLTVQGATVLGSIRFSSDSGSTWTEQTTAPDEIADIDAWDAQSIYAVTFGNTLLRTANGGTTWSPSIVPIPNSTANDMITVETLSPAAVVVGSGNTATAFSGTAGLLRSEDGGQTWLTGFTSGTSSGRFQKVVFVDGRVGFAVGLVGGFSNPRAVFRTSNSGRTWQSALSGFAAATTEVPAVSPSDRNNAFAFASDGNLSRTDNGGSLWTLVTPRPTATTVLNIRRITANAAWSVGSGGSILQYTASGAANTPPGKFTNVSPLDSTVIGLNTLPVQARWTRAIDINANPVTYQVVLTTDDTLETETLRLNANADTTFQLTPAAFAAVRDGAYRWRVEASDGIATVSSYPTRIVFSRGLSTRLENAARPTRFALEQNYPNPFNPSTEIKYQVSGVSDVRLDVFDMLGRKVATLVNQRQAAGAYQVNFNAATLSSGVYFYRLQAGTFNDTKKMLLVK
jgi:photosystem II stability/assembly factor-like uncharacterized protein